MAGLWYECGNGWVKSRFAKTDMGADAYLYCPGPSLKNIDPETVRGRGRKVFAINTAYPYVKPDVWIGMDKIDCYDRNLAAEPFTKIFRGTYGDEMILDGKGLKYFDNTYFATVAEPEKGKTMFDYRSHDVNFVWYKHTLAVALHTMVWMGAKNIFLVGCDLGGDSDYYDDRKLTGDQRDYNRRLYRSQVDFLNETSLEGLKRGIRFYSCTPESPINKFMQYIPYSEAIKKSEEKVDVKSPNIINHCLDTRKEKILHVTNWGIWGGVQSVVENISKEYNKHQHVVAQLHPEYQEKDYLDYMHSLGIRVDCVNNKITEQYVKTINPKLIFFHNTKSDFVQKPYDWLKNYKTVRVYHGVIPTDLPTDFSWFVSDWVYGNCKNIPKDSFILPPVFYVKDFQGIKRPKRRPVIGRIQSSTNIGRGKYPDKFFELLEEVGAKQFIVGHQGGDAPVKPGKMREYLKNIDIFVVWGDTLETWSMVLSEANLSGIPVVIRDMNDGASEQVGKTKGGIIVKTEKEFIEAVKTLIKDKKQRDALANAGREWIVKNANSSLLGNYLVERYI